MFASTLGGAGGGGESPGTFPSPPARPADRCRHSSGLIAGPKSTMMWPAGGMGFVYIYRSGDGDVFKIGKAKNVDQRIKTHATGNPEPLTEFDVIETEHYSQCETYLHHRLRSKRSTRSGSTEWFEVDPVELRAVVADARHYANEVVSTMAEAHALSESECDDRMLEPTDEVMETYCRLVKLREDHDTLGFEKDYLEAKLKVFIGTASGIERVADWKTTVAHRLDGERFKAEQPDVYASFLCESRSRRFNLL
jgi:hypothetical protein